MAAKKFNVLLFIAEIILVLGLVYYVSLRSVMLSSLIWSSGLSLDSCLEMAGYLSWLLLTVALMVRKKIFILISIIFYSVIEMIDIISKALTYGLHFSPFYLIRIITHLSFLICLTAIAVLFVKGKPKKIFLVLDIVFISIEVIFYLISSPAFFLYVGLILTVIYMTYPDGFSKSVKSDGTPIESSNFIPIGKHVLLLIFTFGIWACIWIYRTTELTNCDKSEPPRTPANQLLLCLFVPFYVIFWTYNTAQRVERLSKDKGLSCDMAMTCLVLAIFVSVVAYAILQDKINAYILTSEQTTQITAPMYGQQNAAVQTAAPPAPQTTAQVLTDLKGLLDNGIITQEEFEVKKKQLLGL